MDITNRTGHNKIIWIIVSGSVSSTIDNPLIMPRHMTPMVKYNIKNIVTAIIIFKYN